MIPGIATGQPEQSGRHQQGERNEHCRRRSSRRVLLTSVMPSPTTMPREWFCRRFAVFSTRISSPRAPLSIGAALTCPVAAIRCSGTARSTSAAGQHRGFRGPTSRFGQYAAGRPADAPLDLLPDDRRADRKTVSSRQRLRGAGCATPRRPGLDDVARHATARAWCARHCLAPRPAARPSASMVVVTAVIAWSAWQTSWSSSMLLSRRLHHLIRCIDDLAVELISALRLNQRGDFLHHVHVG